MLAQTFFLTKAFLNTRLTNENIQKLQNKSVRNIVNYAYKNVPFYRSEWKKAGINPSDIRTVEDLRKLPIINKKTVLANQKSFFSNEFKQHLNSFHSTYSFLFMRSTAGTSGRQMKIYFNPFAKYFLDAIFARSLLSLGYNPRKSMLYFWWQHDEQKSFHNYLGFFKKAKIPCSWDEEKQFAFMQKVKPEYMYYYPSSLYFIARKILNQNIKLNFTPKTIFTNGEIITSKMRETIEDAFNSSVYDQYGANEFNIIASECQEKTGYHLNADGVFAEILDENCEDVSNGESGQVVLTGLANKAFPLIRYEIGDFATKAENQGNHHCGNNLPIVFKSVDGRYEHSHIGKKGISQKELIDKFLSSIQSYQNLFKFQIYFKNTATLNYSTFDGKQIKFDTQKIGRFDVHFRKVRNVKKNRLTGKIILVEKR